MMMRLYNQSLNYVVSLNSLDVAEICCNRHTFPTSESQVVCTIGKFHLKLPINEFDPSDLAFLHKVRRSSLDMSQADRFDGLAECHTGPNDRFAVRHIKSVLEKI